MTTNTEIVKKVEEINTGLQSFEERKAQFQKMADEAKEINLVKDRESLKNKPLIKLVREKRIELMRCRTQTEKEGLALRNLVKPVTEMIMEKQKELVAITKKEEDRLNELEEWVDSEQAAIAAEEQARKDELIRQRVKSLLDLGMSFNGTHYSYGERSIDSVTLMEVDAAEFNLFVSHVKEDVDAAAKVAQEKLRVEALTKIRMEEMTKYGWVKEEGDPDLGLVPDDSYAAMFEAVKEEWERKEQEKRDEAEKIRLQVEENNRLKEELREARAKVLYSLGYAAEGDLFISPLGLDSLAKNIVSEYTSKEFEVLCQSIIEKKQEKEEEHRIQKRYEDRAMQLIQMGFLVSEDAFLYLDKIILNKDVVKTDSDEDFTGRVSSLNGVIAEIKAEADRKAQQILEDAKKEAADAERKRIEDAKKAEEEKQRIAAEKEARKLARRPDKEKIVAFSEVFASLHIPELKTEEGKAVWANIDQKIQELTTFIKQQAETL